MDIKIYNDKKQKHQSFEAYISEFEDSVERGYGRNEDEAVGDYYVKFGRSLAMMIIAGSRIKSNAVRIIAVNCKGEPI